MSVLHLQYRRPDGENEVYHMKDVRRYHIGRGSTCEVRILDMKMSRQHCAVECVHNIWQVVDLGSTNGCTVDGERVQENRAVHPGMMIRAGSTELVVLAINESLDYEIPVASNASDDADNEDTIAVNDAAEPTTEATPAPPKPAPATEPALKVEPPVSQPTTPAPAPAPPAPEAAIDNKPTERLVKPVKPAVEPAATVTPPAAKPAPTAPAASSKPAEQPAKPAKPSTGSVTRNPERKLFITVLGKRIGPIERSLARELRMKELKGQLKEDDIKDLPQEG